MLEVANLDFSYGSRQVLDIASLTIEKGESLAVLGRSGSGKSTLLHCLSGLLRPDVGTVCVDGVDLYGLDSESRVALRRERYGFVFQHHLLLADLPLVENVALPLMLLGSRRSSSCRIASGVMSDLGIDALADRLPGEVSGGESQRAAVARALVHDPMIVMADEPTGALDRRNATMVAELLLSGVADRDAALVLVSHDPEVAGLCDRVVMLDDGRLVE